MTDRLATLLAAASQAPDRTMRLAYVAEARCELARETERLRELTILLEAQEAELRRQGGAR